MNDNQFWVSVWAVIAVALIAIVALTQHHWQVTNDQIKAASTCEAAVLVAGGPQTDSRLLTCALGKRVQAQ
jgi:hypothetical protein